MRLTPVTVLAGPAGSAATRLAAWHGLADFAGTLVVRDPGTAAPADACACCGLADGLTRELRRVHQARSEGRLAFDRVLVDATGADPRPAIAALARTPLTSIRLAFSAVLATSPGDALALSLADAVLAPREGPGLVARIGLYAAGTLDVRGWLEGRPAGRIAIEWPEPCAWADVESAVQAVQLAAGSSLHRLKGLVHVAGEPGPRVVQAFGHTRYPSARAPAWPEGPRHTRFTIAADALESRGIARILQGIPRPPT